MKHIVFCFSSLFSIFVFGQKSNVEHQKVEFELMAEESFANYEFGDALGPKNQFVKTRMVLLQMNYIVVCCHLNLENQKMQLSKKSFWIPPQVSFKEVLCHDIIMGLCR